MLFTNSFPSSLTLKWLPWNKLTLEFLFVIIILITEESDSLEPALTGLLDLMIS